VLPSLSVVLPAYNEAANLPTAVGRCLTVLPTVAEKFEVIVVDDGSVDDTWEVAAGLVVENHPRVRLLRHARNAGYGAAILTGFGAATGEYLFFTDADNQYDISELEWFAPLAATNDVVLGFRVYRYDRVLRSIVSWIYNRLVGVLFRVRVRDIDCSFKLFRREVIERIAVESHDFFVDTELVARARKWNYSIAERGVRHYPRVAGQTTVRPSDIPRTLATVARMWQRIYFPRRSQLPDDEAGGAHGVTAEEFTPAPLQA
jgi:dolichol-phosphate mannosyltransferase